MRGILFAALIGLVSSVVAAVNTTTVNATTTDLACFTNNTITKIITSFVPLTLTVTETALETNVFSYDVENGTTSWVGGVSPTQSAMTFTETSTVEVTAIPASLIQSIVTTITETSVTTVTETVSDLASSAVGTGFSDVESTVTETPVTTFTETVSDLASSAVGTDLTGDETTTLTIYDTITSTRAVVYASRTSVSNSPVLSATSTEEDETIVVTETHFVTAIETATNLDSSLSTSMLLTDTVTTYIATAQSTVASDISNAAPGDDSDDSTQFGVSTSNVNVSGSFPQLTVFRTTIVSQSTANVSLTGPTSVGINATSVCTDEDASTTVRPTGLNVTVSSAKTLTSLGPFTNFTSLNSTSLESATKTFHPFGNRSSLPGYTPIKSVSMQSTLANASVTETPTQFNTVSVATNISITSTFAAFSPSSVYSPVSSNTTTVCSIDQALATTLVPVYGASPNTEA